MAAMVNMTQLLNGKDSRWLQLEVCREFQRNKCSRPDTECKFAHPPPNVEVQNGRVTACYDSIKGRCNREKPPCKYFHPPQHLKDQLLINGRNHLALKNALMQQMGIAPNGQPLLQQPMQPMTTNPYLTGQMGGGTYSPYFGPGQLVPTLLGPADPSQNAQLGACVQQQPLPPAIHHHQQKLPRQDRIEMDMKSMGSFYYENFTFPGMMPYKRAATTDKAGLPVYQQLMQLQQPFVSCEYPGAPPPAPSSPGAAPMAPTDPPTDLADNTAPPDVYQPPLPFYQQFAAAAAPNKPLQAPPSTGGTKMHHALLSLFSPYTYNQYAAKMQAAAAAAQIKPPPIRQAPATIRHPQVAAAAATHPYAGHFMPQRAFFPQYGGAPPPNLQNLHQLSNLQNLGTLQQQLPQLQNLQNFNMAANMAAMQQQQQQQNGAAAAAAAAANQTQAPPTQAPINPYKKMKTS